MAATGRLLNASIDGDSLAVEIEIDGTFYRIEQPVTSALSTRAQRFFINEVLPALFAMPPDEIDLDYIEPNDPEDSYED